MSVEEEALRIDVFWEALKGYPMEGVAKAFDEAIHSLKWFPAPIEIIELILVPKPGQKEIDRIEWMEPTEESRSKALQIISELKMKWEKEDKEREEKRKVEFEKKRVLIKKQQKLFLR